MHNLFNKLTMTSYGEITNNIDDATLVHIPDEETAEELSEWAKNNNYPAFVNCEAGWYYWDEKDETFYKEEAK